MEQGVILAVGGDDLPQTFRLGHRLPHHLPVLHAPAIVGETGGMGSHTRHVRQGSALLGPCNRAVGMDMDHRVPVYGIQLRLQMLRGIRHGVQVGHGAHMGVTAAGGGQGTGTHRLFI